MKSQYRKIMASYSAADIIDAAKSCIAEKGRRKYGALTSPDQTREYLQLHLGIEEREVFAVVYLDSQHKVIAIIKEFVGTIDAACVYPREIVKAALGHNAAAVILSHNHPSGHAEPSDADRRITERLKDALALVDVRVLDHLIVGDDSIVSFAERGLI